MSAAGQRCQVCKVSDLGHFSGSHEKILFSSLAVVVVREVSNTKGLMTSANDWAIPRESPSPKAQEISLGWYGGHIIFTCDIVVVMVEDKLLQN